MTDNLNNVGGAAGTNLTVQTLERVDDTAPYVPTPCLITNAVVPEWTMVEGRIRQWRVTDKATGCVGKQGQEEGNEKMVGIPESFERLVADLSVCGGVDEQHA